MTPQQLRRVGPSHITSRVPPLAPGTNAAKLPLPAACIQLPTRMVGCGAASPSPRCTPVQRHTLSHSQLISPAASTRYQPQQPTLRQRHPSHHAPRSSFVLSAQATPTPSTSTPSTSAPQPTNAATPQQQPLRASAVPYEAKVVGCLLGSACGDVLGHPLEGLGPAVIEVKRPQGNVDFHLSARWELAGKYSGDTQMLLAIAHSLVNSGGKVDPADIARRQVEGHERESWRGYREWDQRVLEALADGDTWEETGRKFLLGGWSLSGAARIAPVALVLRNASNVQLLQAVTDAIQMTHTHQTGIEAAFVQALAVKALVRGGPEAATPEALLRHLMDRCREDDMKKRFKLMLMWLPHAHASGLVRGGINDWGAFLTSSEYQTIIKVRRMIAEEQQGKGTQAVACALWALVCCWDAPEDAVVLSSHFGGLTHNVAAMTGALAGALHGAGWLPARWLSNLENGPGGRDEMIMLARQLAALDAAASGP